MRIDRRGNPGNRKIPAFGDIDGNLDEVKIPNAGHPPDGAEIGRKGRVKDVPSNPSDAFSDLDYKERGFFNKFATVITAVGRALKDIKQGNSKTFD